MLPIGNRPLVDYIVEDCIKAGIVDIYFVVGEDSAQIQAYYSENAALNAYLEAKGKAEALDLVAPPQNVTFHYITQPAGGKYGTAVPVALAAAHIPAGESAVVLMGDDFLYNKDGHNDVARLIEMTPDGGVAMLGVNVEPEAVTRYGVLELDETGNYRRIVEKPSVDEAPSTLINVSKYVLNSDLIQAADAVAMDEASGEYFLPDVINEYVAAGGEVKVVPAVGEFLDGGSLDGWLHANAVVCG